MATNPDPNPSFLQTAVEVADFIMGQAAQKDGQLTWRKIDTITKEISYDHTDLYSGAAGIGLFLLELYKQMPHPKYLRMAQRAIRGAAIRERARPLNPAFLTGRLGVAYASAKLYEATDNKKDLQQALVLARDCSQPTNGLNEYINGNAGSLLCLLYLYTVSQQPWLLQAVNDYTGHILRHTRQATVGAYWDRSAYQVQPLCGFSHGTSGIGFVFLELGRYLKNPAYYLVAEQAFAYENACFDASTGSWPDYRLNMWKPEDLANFESAYAQGNTAVFSQTGDMTAWCHGAPGIVLSRTLGYRLTHNKAYNQDITRGLAKTKQAMSHDLSLCHGQAGNLEAFIESADMLGRKRAWTQARADGRLLQKHWLALWSRMQANTSLAEQQDLELFTGLAGVGYGMLRLHDPASTPSILAPHVSGNLHEKPDAALRYLRLNRQELQNLLAGPDIESQSAAPLLKREMMARYPSNGLLFIKSYVHKKNLQALLPLSDETLLDCKLTLDSDCRLHIISPREAMLLRYTVQGIEEKPISQFCFVVLKAFKTSLTVREAITRIGEQYGITTEQQKQLLQTKSLEQMRQALYAGLLFVD